MSFRWCRWSVRLVDCDNGAGGLLNNAVLERFGHLFFNGLAAGHWDLVEHCLMMILGDFDVILY